ncbi:MAG: hypothetical protein A2939_01970 [Parcubacteria group bacterium RIFCSPLOWO2_01_FULL_48_18]|nr:MAG: hypothetical protein A2939_01970 [Parcubacteria group bacterium RIFCSPLOWO2_01_FULL_48_18]
MNPILALTGVFFIGVGAVILISRFEYNRSDTAIGVLALAPQIENCMAENAGGARARCYNDLFADYLERYDPESLFAQFEKAMSESADIRRDCHQVIHAIGRETHAVVKNIADTFEMGRDLTLCAGGYFHGAVEKMFRPSVNSGQDPDNEPIEEHISAGELETKIPVLCAAVKDESRKDECYHGIGHGTLYLLEDLTKSLGFCNLILTKQNHFSCYSGVFMEHELSGMAFDVNVDDPHYPCRDFKSQQLYACYYVQSFRLVRLGFSKEDIVKTCREAPSPAGAMCVRGYGIFHLAHEALAEGFPPTVQFCESLDRANARVCAEAVASRLAAHMTSGELAMPFCALFESEYIRKRCFNYTADVLRLGHKIDRDALIADCREYVADASRAEECVAEA